MRIAYTDEQEQLRRELRSYFAELVGPEIQEEARAGDTGGPASLEAVRQMGHDRWPGVGWPTEYGGRGFGPIEQFIFMNESWRAGAPVPFLSVNTVGPTIMDFGTAEQKDFFLPRILDGELHFSIGYTEPASGTDLASLRTRAVRDGDEWVINGQKIYTSLASYADYVWLAARTDPDAPKHKGITMFLVPTTDPGFSYSEISTMVNASTFNTFYDDVRVPHSAIIGDLNRGWDLIVNQLNYERVALAPPGMIEGVADDVLRYARETKLADGRRLVDQDWVRLNLARVHAGLDVLRLLNWKVGTAPTLDPAAASATKAKRASTATRTTSSSSRATTAPGPGRRADHRTPGGRHHERDPDLPHLRHRGRRHLRGGGQRAGGHLHDLGGLQLRPRRHRDAGGVLVLGAAREPGHAGAAGPGGGALRHRPHARHRPGAGHHAGAGGASTITKIVVSISLLFAFIQIGAIIWPQERNYRVERFFEGNFVRLGDVNIAWHSIIVFGLAIAVALGLRLLLYRTRLGIAMRAVVDNRDLTWLNGINPGRTSMAAWAQGCSLAALSGVLIGPILQLSVVGLTLLVINAYAAAMVGRLRSLPLTFLGAAILGIGENLMGYAQFKSTSAGTIELLGKIRPSLPIIMLFLVLVILPQDRSVFDASRLRTVIPMPSVRKAVVAWAVLVAGAFVVSHLLPADKLTEMGKGLALAIVMLSLVPLIGYAGQISLAQLAFAGIGAFVAWKVAPGGGPLGLVAAAVVAGVVGALVALATLRLKDFYLALVTMAFAILLERNFLGQQEGFRTGTDIARLGRLPFFEGDHANFVLLALVFGAIGVLISALRLGHPGRRLQAMKDSPAACATLGLDLTVTKLGIFAFSAGVAGLGGALLAGWKAGLGVTQTDYSLLEGAYSGLPVVLLAVIGGITSVSGALVGGLLLAGMPLVGAAYPVLANLMKVAPGLAGISLGRNPDGAVGQVMRDLSERRADRDEARVVDVRHGVAADRSPAPAPPPVPELLAVGGRIDPSAVRALEASLGLDVSGETCRG